MGRRNFLVEGVSGAGKTAVADELIRRGLHAVHGDRVLAYQGDPRTGRPTDTSDHEHHLWDVGRVRALVADDTHRWTFLCGGARNHARFLDLLDAVFVLDLDAETLGRRLDRRPPGEYGATPAERAHVMRLHLTGEDLPTTGVRIDATRPVAEVVDDLVERVGAQET